MSDGLKQGWRRLRFEQMAQNVNVRVDDPNEAGVEYYVGLEHLDSDSLKIRRWGSPADVTATKLLFEPGDIIFGRRRAYQRKLGVAEWRGIASAHSLVLRAKPDVVLPEFLPFFMQSDLFMDRAKQISVGSLSPTINWKTLAKQEFALPPLEEQRRIANLGRQAASASDSSLAAAQAGHRLFSSSLHRIFTQGVDDGNAQIEISPSSSPQWETLPLADVATVERGKFSHRPRNLPEFYGGPYPFAQTGDVASARGRNFKASQHLSDLGVKYSRSFPPDSILITIAAVIGATAITTEETWCPDSVVGIIPGDRVIVDYLEYVLRYRRTHLEHAVATQTAQKNINLAVLRPLPISVPEWSTQEKIVELLKSIEIGIAAQYSRAEKGRRLFQSALAKKIGEEQ
ncbi:restriction endonuclease subunit S [Halochromatium roseum]|uniref:restriction endonuclease subunit S n=1 Tax=Halochromatium roseum TaxID=391920 RepID=UPI0019148ED7|nr:restriction endonuclease subunit S [Halochromatium roseum]MBK5938392.1 hypothetical protein [Halochromatium roseum]